ncbi:MAG: hypothetical protein ACTSO9_08730 [Candidatus Helarchaeota archaeon]
MGFLNGPLDKERKIKKLTKEELRQHNKAVIELYKKELAATEKILLIDRNNSSQIGFTNENNFAYKELIQEETINDNFDLENALSIKSEGELEKEKGEEIIEKISEEEEISEEDLIREFERETGKHAIWRGKMTKTYKIWKEKRLK